MIRPTARPNKSATNNAASKSSAVAVATRYPTCSTECNPPGSARSPAPLGYAANTPTGPSRPRQQRRTPSTTAPSRPRPRAPTGKYPQQGPADERDPNPAAQTARHEASLHRRRSLGRYLPKLTRAPCCINENRCDVGDHSQAESRPGHRRHRRQRAWCEPPQTRQRPQEGDRAHEGCTPAAQKVVVVGEHEVVPGHDMVADSRRGEGYLAIPQALPNLDRPSITTTGRPLGCCSARFGRRPDGA
jgi:hypothetical protein